MNRRELLLASGAMLAAPLARAQSRVARIGFFGSAAPTPASLPIWEAFTGRLRDAGWVEGRNLVIESRYAAGAKAPLATLAGELVRLDVELIVALGVPHAQAAKEATASIPIVTVIVGDPVGSGLAASLARPGANVTGMSSMAIGIVGKQLQLLLEAAPGTSRVAFLWNPEVSSNVAAKREAEVAATAMAVQLAALEIRRPEDLDTAFAAITRDRANALLAFDTVEIFANRHRIIEFAARHRVPTMFLWTQYVDDGGLMSYGPVPRELFRGAAGYVDRILRGAKPADLPIQQPTIFELSINLRTAKALGLGIPQAVLIRADRVIE